MSALSLRIERELGLALDASDRSKLARLDVGPEVDVAAAASAILVHETWFFRDAGVWGEIAAIGRAATAPLRVLSAPCATGPEAWSVAMTLAGAGLGAGAFDVLGVDIGDAAIAAARAAGYGPSAFRAERRAVEDEWLVREGELRWIRHPLSGAVRFRAANLVAPGALAGEAPFDVILCRNFLVYLTADARAAVERLLYRLLAPGGALFLGAGELPVSRAFVRDGPAERFRFRRASAADAGAREPGRPSPSESRRASPGEPRRPSARRTAPPRAGSSRPALPRAASVVAAPAASLEHARALADRGQVDAALAMVERVLVETGHAAETYALLGTIESARGRSTEAASAWRRALYLDPSNETARVSLARAPGAAEGRERPPGPSSARGGGS